MRDAFAKTSNVQAFLKGIDRANKRGAAEAGIVLVTGEAGYGKSKTVMWWGLSRSAVYVRAKAAWTPHWFLAEMCRELQLQPERKSEDLFPLVMKTLLQRGAPIIVDEVEHCLHETKVIETIRDLIDVTLVPLVMVGMEGVVHRLNRLPQIVSRVAATVHFGPATVEDVRVLCDQLCEVKVAADLIAEIHAQSGGRVRQVMNAIAAVEAAGKRAGAAQVKLADLPEGIELTNEQLVRRLRGRDKAAA